MGKFDTFAASPSVGMRLAELSRKTRGDLRLLCPLSAARIVCNMRFLCEANPEISGETLASALVPELTLS